MSENKNLIQKATQEVTEKKQPQSLKDWVQAMTPQIAKALPKVMTPERFTRIALTALSANPQLANCTRDSFLGGLMQAAQLGLEPNTPLGQAYLIPFKNNKKGVTECQFQVGYKGIIDLAHRSGDVQSITAHVVYENDTFEFEYGLESKLIHKPAMKDRGAVVWVYATYKLVNGGYGFEVMSVEDVRNHAKKYSQAYNSSYSPWTTNFEEMAKKTVLKKVLKYAPLKTDFVTAIAVDEGIAKTDTKTAEDIEINYIVVNEDGEVETEVQNAE